MPFGEVLLMPLAWGRGRSREMRPSLRDRGSSALSKMLPKLGRDSRGGLGSGLLSDADWSFSIFSKWLRRDETGLMEEPSVLSVPELLSMAANATNQSTTTLANFRLRLHATWSQLAAERRF